MDVYAPGLKTRPIRDERGLGTRHSALGAAKSASAVPDARASDVRDSSGRSESPMGYLSPTCFQPCNPLPIACDTRAASLASALGIPEHGHQHRSTMP